MTVVSQDALPSLAVQSQLELARSLGLKVVNDLATRTASSDFVEKVPIHFARKFGMIGLAAGAGERLPIALADLSAWGQLQTVSRFLGREVEPLLAPAADVTAAINSAYQQRSGQAQDFIEKLDPGTLADELKRLDGRDDLLDVAGRAPVVKLVSLVLFEAVQARASDVHVQPYEDSLVVRMRIDGVLHNAFRLPRTIQDEMISRIKVMARMNIAEKRLPQDGRATVQVGDRLIDLRIATLPASFGERVVVRLLDKSQRLYDVRELGMQPDVMERFRQLVHLDHGLILVTGPTGSGKTTTLYAALQEINGAERNILTLEDPIEYQLEGISQTQVSEKKGMTFASGLRSVLRQDPDIIMIGEIRDRETAVMAIQSALTGHLVFSTLHTNDAASAVARLLDLGIEPYLLASSMVGVLAQRLVRQLCPRCAAPVASAELKPLIGDRPTDAEMNLRSAAGCASCRQTGYRGRLGIFQLLLVDEPIRRHIQARATASEINTAARTAGMKSLKDDGAVKAAKGLTTVEEVFRVTGGTSQETESMSAEPGARSQEPEARSQEPEFRK